MSFKIGNYELDLCMNEGFWLIAPASFWNATPEQVKARIGNGGCGPGKIGDWFVPDTLWGESVKLPCDVHDWMYSEGETLEDKRIADVVLDLNILLTIDDGEFLDIPRLIRGREYYIAVSRAGKAAFLKGKGGPRLPDV